MDYFNLFLLMFSILVVCCQGEGKFEKNEAEQKRSGRKYDTPYGSPGNFGDDSDDVDDSDENPGTAISAIGAKYPNFANLKGYDYPPAFPKYYKDYTFDPYWKGAKAGKGGIYDISTKDPSKMMEMMTMMNTMDRFQEPSKDENKGFLSIFSSDTKQLALAAVIPLAIVLASVIPVLVNYMMTGTTVPLVSTTASNKEGRNIEGLNTLDLDDIMKRFEEVARSIEKDECIQKSICRVASSNTTAFGPHVRKAASAVANFVKENWIKDARVKSLVKGLKEGSCENVCQSSSLSPRIKSVHQ